MNSDRSWYPVDLSPYKAEQCCVVQIKYTGSAATPTGMLRFYCMFSWFGSWLALTHCSAWHFSLHALIKSQQFFVFSRVGCMEPLNVGNRPMMRRPIAGVHLHSMDQYAIHWRLDFGFLRLGINDSLELINGPKRKKKPKNPKTKQSFYIC